MGTAEQTKTVSYTHLGCVAAGFWVALATVFPGFCVGFACPGFCSEPVVACAVFGETATVALGDRTGVGEISDDGLALGNGLFEDAEGWLLQPAKTQSNRPTCLLYTSGTYPR